jgi:hypothetical protein
MTKGCSFVLAVLLAAATPAFAQQPPPGPAPEATAPAASQGVPWSSLSADQQRLLGKFTNNWNTLPPERQQALARGSTRWLGMSPEQRGQAQQRFQRWRTLPPDQRRELRDRWERFQSLPPDRQGAVRQNFRRFQQLPPERRQMLRERWRNASPAERQQMIQRAREQHMRRMEMRPPQQMRPPPGPGRPRR